MNVSEATQTVATEYNGWSNRETWIVNLWMTGDQGYYCQAPFFPNTISRNFGGLANVSAYAFGGMPSAVWMRLVL